MTFMTPWSKFLEHPAIKKKLKVLLAHPDLAGKLAQRGELTEESQNEQKSVGLNQLTSKEFAEFQNLKYYLNSEKG